MSNHYTLTTKSGSRYPVEFSHSIFKNKWFIYPKREKKDYAQPSANEKKYFVICLFDEKNNVIIFAEKVSDIKDFVGKVVCYRENELTLAELRALENGPGLIRKGFMPHTTTVTGYQ